MVLKVNLKFSSKIPVIAWIQIQLRSLKFHISLTFKSKPKFNHTIYLFIIFIPSRSWKTELSSNNCRPRWSFLYWILLLYCYNFDFSSVSCLPSYTKVLGLSLIHDMRYTHWARATYTKFKSQKEDKNNRLKLFRLYV